MPDYETIIVCALIPVVYVVTYMAGKYDLLGQLAQMLQEKTASLTDEYAKVLHGRWEQTGMHLLPYECSACGSKEGGRTNYCPNCGAKMDLEVSDGKA